MEKIQENDSIIIRYRINTDDKFIKIFGDKFVKTNKDNCKILYKEKEFDLNDKFNFLDLEDIKDILEIKLIHLNKITDMSHSISEEL